jgi:O-antigen ligase
LILFLLLLTILWIAGGASHADVTGQVITRSGAWLVLVLAILCGVRPNIASIKPVFWLLLATVLLPLLQLVPLPPSLSLHLPGRDFLSSAPFHEQDIWLPWSLTPSATINAASSLIVPIITLYLVSAMSLKERAWLPTILLGAIFLSMLVGLLQFSGLAIDNPFINDSIGSVSGTFANRNHFALLLAIGCLIAPVWAFSGERGSGWRPPVALALVTLFALTILASGSRAGIATGLVALAIGLALVWSNIRHAMREAPRWAFPTLIASIIGIVALFITVSIAADRADSILRALENDPGQDMRARGLPTVLSMIATYFPAGSGFGGFDPLFRLHEPFVLLKPTYFNHAHNDFLEIVLDGGMPALLLLLAAIGWYIIASLSAWRGSGKESILPKLGSAILLLIFIASAFDYPARTPMIMAMTVIAALWLSQNRKPSNRADFT